MPHDADQRHDLRLAHRVQQALLPQNHPTIAGFDLLGWNQPAQHTGGDYYDWFTLPDGRVALVMADATGHGVTAALSIVAFRAYVRAMFARDDDFAMLVARVNDFLVDDLIDGRFVTALIGLLDPPQRRLVLHAAGHGPLFFVHASDARLVRWQADGIPLGVEKAQGLPQVRTIDFAPGDLLLSLTDGFLDWPGTAAHGLQAERFSRLIADHHVLPLHDLIASLHGQVLECVGDVEQRDDLTAIALRCTG